MWDLRQWDTVVTHSESVPVIEGLNNKGLKESYIKILKLNSYYEDASGVTRNI